ncbi:MacB family efflux pump subunit [Erwiniaceae bacterium L1_54_6]|nr:MacB family efflux pump subunit [Erwiniaceae bacterium L1_54_6]
MNIIELKNITRAYLFGSQSLSVLKDINLSIASGEMVAIIGPSGSGKSTLLNILGCLDAADSGEYRLGGQNIASLSADALAKVRREHIGFIFQRYHLMPDLNALSNVEIPAIYANAEGKSRRARASELLERLGLHGREHHKPGELSGGQQQRVSIARALINGAEIILADEPTGALDSRSGEEVLRILSDLNREGHTVIIVTHDMKVAQHADRIIEIQDGSIVADSGRATDAAHSRYHPSATESQSKWRGLYDRLRESLRMALHAMNAHRLRTSLTMTGIIFGIAAVVTVVALGQGARQSTLESIQGLGTNVVTIYAGGDFVEDEAQPTKTLVMSDVQAIARQQFVAAVSPEMMSTQPIRYLANASKATVYGVGKDYFSIQGIKITAGNNFSDELHASQEIIIDENTRNKLFGDKPDSAIGKMIILGSVPVRVVGVAKLNDGANPNRLNVWLPWSTMMYRITGQTALTSFSIKLQEDIASGPAVAALSEILTARHRVKDFLVFNRDKYRQAIENAAATLTLLILMVAAIALTIGSIGVMNIMLVSVTERTHEIGVRMAAGARRGDIMQQFMIEAVLVCLVGGVLGVGLSLAIGPLVSLLAGGLLTAIYSWESAATAFICSTVIGMIFGYLPARKAARMDPVTALASE